MSTEHTNPQRWQPALGAVPGADGTHFRVWAPKPASVELVLYDGGSERTVEMHSDGEYRTAHLPDVGAGARYAYRLDGEGPYPDPCSRSQPEGVHAPSEVVHASAFAWTDGSWRPPAPHDLAVYELHVGTLTPEGSFDAAVGQLERIKSLGVTAVEVMPVASFDGRWNWGYDGVALYAPAAVYGGPDGFRRFADAAHATGLAVVLDVVYNHLGPSGNYTSLYSDHYYTSKHHTAWGDALNFDDTDSEHVRRFFVENLLHWIHEYHVDGFRLDATFAIQDDSERHMLAELSDARRQYRRTQHVPYLIAETHENDVRYIQSVAEGGFGFDAVWADDFHHIVRVMITHEREGYYQSYEGTADELAAVVQGGFFYSGQHDPNMGEPRGTDASGQPPYHFVYVVQNHDQVGNRAFGQRLNVTASHADFLAASALLLLLPQTPMLFQGQEFLASTPFLYFTDHAPELGRLVTEGRRKEFASFAAFDDPSIRELIPDPQDPKTFQRSKLNLDEAGFGAGLLASRLYSELLTLRREDPVLKAARVEKPRIRTAAAGRAALIELSSSEGTRAVAVNLGEAQALSLPDGASYELRLHTGEPRFGGSGAGPELREKELLLPPHSAAFLVGK